MAGEFDDNKTEAPTPRRREKAREEGQVVFSPDLNSGVALMLLALAAAWVVPRLTQQMGQLIVARIQGLEGRDWGLAASVLSGRWMLDNVWLVAGAITLSFLALNLALAQVQVGFLVTFKPLQPNWEKLDLVQGLQRLWSWDSFMRGLLSLVKVATLSAAAGWLFWTWNPDLVRSTQGTLGQSVTAGWDFIRQLMVSLASVVLAWGVVDYAFKWYRLEQKLRMSREEVKDEHKDEQGDPHVKARIRRLQREASQRKSLRDVPTATVVLTNPTHYAVALRYEAGAMKAPRVVAKGTGAFARRIAALARQHGVPVVENKPVARALYALAQVGKDIPIEFYRAVAEILAAVYKHKRAA